MGGFDDAGKARLRREFIARRRGLNATDLAVASQAVCAGLAVSPEFTAAQQVVTYVGLPGEIDPRGAVDLALTRGRPVYYPRVVGDELEFRRAAPSDLSPGRFGIPEPGPDAACLPDDVAGVLILVPGLAFDRRGGRLGSGRGYYDRALRRSRGAVCLGLTLEAFVVEHLPQRPWDVPVDGVVTERGVYRAPAVSKLRAGELT